MLCKFRVTLTKSNLLETPIAAEGEDISLTLKFVKDNWSAYIPPEYSEPDLVTSLLRIYPPVSKLFNTYICDNFISHKNDNFRY